MFTPQTNTVSTANTHRLEQSRACNSLLNELRHTAHAHAPTRQNLLLKPSIYLSQRRSVQIACRFPVCHTPVKQPSPPADLHRTTSVASEVKLSSSSEPAPLARLDSEEIEALVPDYLRDLIRKSAEQPSSYELNEHTPAAAEQPCLLSCGKDTPVASVSPLAAAAQQAKQHVAALVSGPAADAIEEYVNAVFRQHMAGLLARLAKLETREQLRFNFDSDEVSKVGHYNATVHVHNRPLLMLCGWGATPALQGPGLSKTTPTLAATRTHQHHALYRSEHDKAREYALQHDFRIRYGCCISAMHLQEADWVIAARIGPRFTTSSTARVTCRTGNRLSVRPACHDPVSRYCMASAWAGPDPTHHVSVLIY